MERERLTITLRRDILQRVDENIDGAKLRNRSHAIEYFLTKQLSPQKVPVVISVGSKFTGHFKQDSMSTQAQGKLGSETNIKSILSLLSEQNFDKIVFFGNDETAVRAASIDAEKSNLESLETVVDDSNFSDWLEKIEEKVNGLDFILWDTSIEPEIDLSYLINFHKISQGLATAVLVPKENAMTPASLYGNKIFNINEDPKENSLALSGLYIFSADVFRQGKSFENFDEFIKSLAEKKELNGFNLPSSKIKQKTREKALAQ